MKRILVTGGAGFIGSAVVRRLVGRGYHVVNVDKLTYSGNLDSLRDVAGSPITASSRPTSAISAAMAALMAEERIEAVMHLAAESHVDRSIDGPAAFVETNVVGTFRLLDAALQHWRGLDEAGEGALSLPPCLDRRGVRRPAVRRRQFFGGDALRALVALFGLQGGVRPFRSGLARDLWPCRSCCRTARTITARSTFPKS